MSSRQLVKASTESCWSQNITFAACCLPTRPPPTCFTGLRRASDAVRCCNQAPFQEAARSRLAPAACAARSLGRAALRLRRDAFEALAKLVQPQSEERLRRWASTSLRFKRHLFEKLSAARRPHRLTALEIGVGSSSTTALLSTLFLQGARC
eukprot:gnl/TRDRNA2_/TRDRNA2_168192_c1_seq1.p1 gnl/TRDRNA2_/TRDRNA2_168192_c1~~gnl/TRDRNA2_/TRDRNA2_168192_c1_seq1.p1  ORF type:complete len:152 (+),score=14.79 gnl/TRDRNA2_/TRDRNA2_168192_c1_seq1:90-545(+)